MKNRTLLFSGALGTALVGFIGLTRDAQACATDIYPTPHQCCQTTYSDEFGVCHGRSGSTMDENSYEACGCDPKYLSDLFFVYESCSC